ncbi:MAG: response regulator [Desulfamplus sp.]|nr:response regulator [Desulfamplus sp.]
MNNSEKNILLVDDSPNNIQLIGGALQSQGYNISFAFNGKEAIELVSTSKFDLILLDIMMPEMDGFKVFELLNQNQLLSQDRALLKEGRAENNLEDNLAPSDAQKIPPVIFLTAQTDNKSIIKAFSLGAVDYIRKPFELSEVLARVKTQLELADSKEILVKMNHKLLKEIALRKENEHKLKESEAIYRRLVESVPAIVYAFSKERGRNFSSTKVKDILGYSVEDFKKQPLLWRKSVHPEDKSRYLKAFYGSFEGNHFDIKYRIKGADGDWHWLLDRSFGTHTHFEDGAECIEGIAIEITEQVKMEQEVLKLVKLESAGMFAGGIAHDMNNLNCIVAGNIELAKDDLAGNESTLGLLNDAFDAVQKQTKLIQQLATLTEGFQPKKKRADIELFVRDSISQIEKSLKSNVELSVENAPSTVEFDTTMLKSALENILINADESMPSVGVIKVFVKKSDSVKDINGLQLIAGNYVVISVQDQGVGIPENELNLIFDPYYSKKHRGIQKGMGLGLTLALAMVKKHNGYIFATSKEGAGSQFDIYLPSN